MIRSYLGLAALLLLVLQVSGTTDGTARVTEAIALARGGNLGHSLVIFRELLAEDPGHVDLVAR